MSFICVYQMCSFGVKWMNNWILYHLFSTDSVECCARTIPLTTVGNRITRFLHTVAVRQFQTALCSGLISVFSLPLHTWARKQHQFLKRHVVFRIQNNWLVSDRKWKVILGWIRTRRNVLPYPFVVLPVSRFKYFF